MKKSLFVPLLLVFQNLSAQNLPEKTAADSLQIFSKTDSAVFNHHPVATVVLSLEQMQFSPANFSDVGRLATTSAGVVAWHDGTNNLSVRGNNPATLGWRLEGMDIKNPNIFPNLGDQYWDFRQAGGRWLMFSPKILEKATLLKGSQPANLGNAIGGLMDLRLRAGDSLQHRFGLQMGLISLDLTAEGPLQIFKRKATFLFDTRKSTVGLLRGMGEEFRRNQIDFQDFTFHINLSGRRGGGFRMFSSGGFYRQNFPNKNFDGVVKAGRDRWDRTFSGKTWLAGFVGSIRLGEHSFLKISGLRSRYDNHRLIHRTVNDSLTVFNKLNSDAWTGVGAVIFEHQPLPQVNFEAGVQGKSSPRSLSRNLLDFDVYQIWSRAIWLSFGGRLRLEAGLQHEAVWKIEEEDLKPEIRGSASFQIFRKHRLAVGFSNSRFFRLQNETNATDFPSDYTKFIFYKNFDCLHEWSFSKNWSLKTEFFHQTITGVSSSKTARYFLLNEVEFHGGSASNHNLTGWGKNRGIEWTLDLTDWRSFFGNLNATFLDSKYGNELQEGSRATTWNVRRVANLTIGKSWRLQKSEGRSREIGISIRTNWHSGGHEHNVYWNSNAVFMDYQIGLEPSVQLPNYFRCDANFFWNWNFQNRRRHLWALEFQNLTNQRNVAWHFYNSESQQVEARYQLGLTANLSWRIEF